MWEKPSFGPIVIPGTIETPDGLRYLKNTVALYAAIPDLTDDHLVIAYQAAMTLRETSKLFARPLLDDLCQTIVEEMHRRLHAQAQEPGVQRNLRACFERITGQNFKPHKN